MTTKRTTVANVEMALFNGFTSKTDGERISVIRNSDDKMVAQYPDRGSNAIVNIQIYDESLYEVIK